MSQRAKIIIVAVVAALLLGAAALLARSSNTSEQDQQATGIVASAPSGVSNRSAPIVLQAIAPVDPTSGTFTISPDTPGETQIVEQYVIFWPDEGSLLRSGARYQATFADYQTIDGKAIETLVLEFPVQRGVDYYPLQQEVIRNYKHIDGARNDPLLDALPHSEPFLFRVSLLGETADEVTVLIETLTIQGRDETDESYSEQVFLARQEALGWLASYGEERTDGKTLTIVYAPTDGGLSGIHNHTDEDGGVVPGEVN